MVVIPIRIVRIENPLARQSRVHIRDLGGESFIAHNAYSPARQKVIDTFRKYQTPLNITTEIATMETVKKFVSLNIGLGFVPLMCATEAVARGELVIVPLDGFHYERNLWAVRRRTDAHSHAAQAFMKVIQATLQEGLGQQNIPAINREIDETASVN